MIKARHTWWGKQLFDTMIPFLINRHFQEFRVEQSVQAPRERPLLILANHFSWWDGFTHYYLNQHWLGKRFHVMMLEEELAKRPFFRNAGAFSVNHGKRTVIDTLQYSAQLLQQPENLVLIFPPGRIQSLHDRHFPFEKGVLKVIEKAGTAVQLVLSVILPDYGAKPKPTLHCYLESVPNPQGQTLAGLQMAFDEHYQRACNLQSQKFR